MNVDPNSLLFRYLLAAGASSAAEIVTYPMDLTKTRLQIQGEGGRAGIPARGALATIVGIAREEGPLKLWQGAQPAVYRQIVYSGLRIVFYEAIREKWSSANDGKLPLWQAGAAGLLAGVGAQLIASPTDLVKVQMQMEGRRRLEGKPARVRGVTHAFATIVRNGGVRGLWKGWIPNVQRAAVINMTDMATYDTSKRLVISKLHLKEGPIVHALASFASGFVCTVTSTPCDVVKTRIMNQPSTPDGKGTLYKGSLDCLVKTFRQEGFFALYKGFFPIWMRLAPWCLVFWMTYEQVRKAAGTRAF